MLALRHVRQAVVAAALLLATVAHAQFAPQTWPADQDGANFICADVQYFQANNLAGVGTRFACTDATGKLVPSATACVASGAVVSSVTGAGGLTCSPTTGAVSCTLGSFTCPAGEFASSTSTSGIACTTPAYQQWSDGTFTPLPQEPLSTAGAGLSVADDPSDGATVVSLPLTGTAGSCTNCSVTFDLFGRETARSSGTAPVVSVTGTAQRISVTGGTSAVVDTIGGYYSGAVTSGNEDLGTTLTNGLVCDTTTAGVAVLRTCAAGTDYPAVGVATPGSCTNCSATINGNGQVTTYSSGTAPVTSVGVIAPITTTGGTTPNIGISLPASQVATGTGTNVTSSANLAWNGTRLAVGLPLSSVPSSAQAEFYLNSAGQADVNVVNDDAATTAQSAVRVCSGITCDATNSLLFSHLGHGWTVLSPLLGPGNAFIELEDSTSGANLGFSEYGNGDIVFTTTTSRTPRFYVKNAGNLEVPVMAAPSTPASGELAMWGDSTSKNWACKNDAGTVNHGIQTKTCGASTWISAQADTGLSTCTQPAFTDVSGSLACSQLPAGTCGSTTTYGSTGAYLSQVSIDSTLRVASVTTTSTPLAGGLVYTIASTSLAMGYNQSTLTMPLPAGAPVINTAAAGTSVATTLAANWGSSVQSPPTFALNSLGSVRCSGDITNYFITGVGSETLVTALYYVTSVPATPSNWQVIASGTTTLSGSGAFFRGIGFAASSPTGLIPTNTSSIVLVMYRSDAGSGSTLTTLNANIICELGS